MASSGAQCKPPRLAVPPVSLADNPSPPGGPAPGQRRPLVVSGAPRLAQPLRQVSYVGGDAPGLVAGEQLGRRALA